MIETLHIAEDEMNEILKKPEDHFNELKSTEISPRKLQQSFVAFANADGGEIFVGVTDPDENGDRLQGFERPEDANEHIRTLREETDPVVESAEFEFLYSHHAKYILHISIDKSSKVHYTSSGDCYIRLNASNKKLSGQRLSDLNYAKGVFSYEKQAVEDAETSELIESEFLREYMQRVGTVVNPRRFLKKQRLTSGKHDHVRPNVGGVLLFDEEPQATLHTKCSIKIYRLRTTEPTYKREQLAEMPSTINGPIEYAVKHAIQEIREVLSGAKFQSRGEIREMRYPAEAIHEIIVNAAIHRDYSVNDDIHVKIYDDRIEVQSPGKLPGYITKDNIYEERFSRNPNIVRMLHNVPEPLNHDIGEGLDTAKNKLRDAGLVPPEFEERENAFVVTIKHQKLASLETIILNYLNENPTAKITNKDVRVMSGEDDINKVKKSLQYLRKQGEIVPVDENAKTFDFRYRKA